MPVIIDIVLILLLSAIPASFNYFLNYCFGNPMEDKPNAKEVFSGWSLMLARRRLRSIKNNPKDDSSMLDAIESTMYKKQHSINPHIALDAQDQLNKTILIEAQKYYNWEKAVGMCPYCTGFWCAMIAAGIMFFSVPLQFIDERLYFLLVPIFSHSILRKLNG